MQWDPVGFYIVQYNEFKIIKDVNYVKKWCGHVYKVCPERNETDSRKFV